MAGKNIEKALSEPALRRLPIYMGYLKKLYKEGARFVSCTRISEALKLIPVQIRKDLAFTGIVGKPKVGYEIAELLKKLEDFMGVNNSSEAVIVGVGNLGRAIINYGGFEGCGLKIIAAFDNDPAKIGSECRLVKIFNIDKMANLIRRMNINIGILTLNGAAAQEVCDLMVASGIKAIWNFTAVRLIAPENIIMQHENLSASLLVLTKKLKEVL